MNRSERIHAVLKQGVESGAVPGVVAAAADREGVIYEGAFGERALGSGQAMSTDTVCWIASMTKAITSVAALQCVERGQLKLDAPAKAICPELGQVGVLTGFDSQGQPITRAPIRDITLRHLLTHSAGFSYEIWNTDMQKVQAALDIPSITECKNKALTLPLLFDPGQGWEYGINIDWAGKMIEKVSGLSLGQYLQRHLFEPLGMSSTGFFITDDMRKRLAATHLRADDGKLSLFPFEIPQQPEFEMGGGGLYSTAGDYLKFLRMILNHGQLGGERILTPEGAVSLGLNHMGDCRVYKLKTAIPLSNDAEFFPGMPKSWSLAFQINHEPAPTGRSAGGLMWAGLANSYYWLDPSAGLAGVYITQIFPFADHHSLPLFYDFETAVYQSR
ncbi:MAG: serine hydrolase domain-containing protein [Betaproteobacteria bacterium]